MKWVKKFGIIQSVLQLKCYNIFQFTDKWTRQCTFNHFYLVYVRLNNICSQYERYTAIALAFFNKTFILHHKIWFPANVNVHTLIRGFRLVFACHPHVYEFGHTTSIKDESQATSSHLSLWSRLSNFRYQNSCTPHHVCIFGFWRGKKCRTFRIKPDFFGISHNGCMKASRARKGHIKLTLWGGPLWWWGDPSVWRSNWNVI